MSTESMFARGCGERSAIPQSMSSCHRSDEYANSPLTLRLPSGRSGEPPMPSLEAWLMFCRFF